MDIQLRCLALKDPNVPASLRVEIHATAGELSKALGCKYALYYKVCDTELSDFLVLLHFVPPEAALLIRARHKQVLPTQSDGSTQNRDVLLDVRVRTYLCVHALAHRRLCLSVCSLSLHTITCRDSTSERMCACSTSCKREASSPCSPKVAKGRLQRQSTPNLCPTPIPLTPLTDSFAAQQEHPQLIAAIHMEGSYQQKPRVRR